MSLYFVVARDIYPGSHRFDQGILLPAQGRNVSVCDSIISTLDLPYINPTGSSNPFKGALNSLHLAASSRRRRALIGPLYRFEGSCKICSHSCFPLKALTRTVLVRPLPVGSHHAPLVRVPYFMVIGS